MLHPRRKKGCQKTDNCPKGGRGGRSQKKFRAITKCHDVTGIYYESMSVRIEEIAETTQNLLISTVLCTFVGHRFIHVGDFR